MLLYVMEDHLNKAKEELKRVDHLIFVSLKYTRTVDVILSVIVRLSDALDQLVNTFLEFEKSKKKIPSYPMNPGQRLEFLKTLYKDNEQLMEFLNFHSLLRKMKRMKYTKREEYRRNVTMTIIFEDNSTIDVSIDKLREYYEEAKDFLILTSKIVIEQND